MVNHFFIKRICILIVTFSRRARRARQKMMDGAHGAPYPSANLIKNKLTIVA
jgi:hypothetical protein